MKASRILVVDDEPGMLRAIERVLGGKHHVIGSSSSREAASVAAEFKPELAILDIRMPELDGFELMARLKAVQPDLDVILMTGSLEDQDEKLVRAIRGRAFYFIQKPFDREVLKTLVDRCLDLRWHREENRRHVQRLEAELSDARAFQQGLLPDAEATVGGVDVCCRYTPCSELGGDLYDYALASSGRTALLIADVAGHGASAAMLTGVVKAAFRASHVDGYEPLAVVDRVSSGLAAFTAERFVTLVAALVAPDERRLTFVNAGHPAGLVWRSDRILERLASSGPLVSPAIPSARWNQAAVPIAEGDHVLLYTDGVSEAFITDTELGEDRIRAAITRHANGGASLLDALLADVDRHRGQHPYRDDVTLVTGHVVRASRTTS
jgi:sigma-B regulation protein RsbU (phosphoserine phosphatase)